MLCLWLSKSIGEHLEKLVMVKYLSVVEDADDELSLVDHSTCCILIGCHPAIKTVNELGVSMR